MDSIVISSLTKRYKDVCAVDGLSLTIGQGEIFSLLGVNGAGKTTTVRMLSCLTKPTEGEAYLNGKSIIKDSAEVKRIIGVVPQETAVAGGLSVKENLEFICGIHGFKADETRDKVSTVAKRLALEQVLIKRVSKLSGGMKRRVSIAMALISEPQILFLDEPTLGLDVISRRELWDIIREIKGEVTVMLTTHYMEEAEALSDRIGIMKDGKLLICDTAENIRIAAQEDSFEDAFVKIVREGKK